MFPNGHPRQMLIQDSIMSWVSTEMHWNNLGATAAVDDRVEDEKFELDTDRESAHVGFKGEKFI
jgi:hypothetical protein